LNATPTHKPRAIVYVDGFNLYYGALRGTAHKWLNLERYFSILRPFDDLQQIYYFTAPVIGSTRPNQEIYLRALATLPLVTVVMGKFKKKRLRCAVAACAHAGNRMFDAVEEKRTDVHIGIHMLDDAYQNRCERLILVSGDSDLVPALNVIKSRFPLKTIVVYVPTRNSIRGAAVELRSAADKDRDLPLNLLPLAQFSNQVAVGTGQIITKPASW
jgi:uncharacterized LabA/DUF88 family protein